MLFRYISYSFFLVFERTLQRYVARFLRKQIYIDESIEFNNCIHVTDIFNYLYKFPIIDLQGRKVI